MKLQEMREKTVEELKSAIVDFKKQLFDFLIESLSLKWLDIILWKLWYLSTKSIFSLSGVLPKRLVKYS